MSILSVRSLRKDFGIKEILREGNFSLGPSDRVGVIGVNGSGKSTFLKMVAGLEPPDGGEITVNPNHKLVYLPQQPELDEQKTVLEQVFADSGEQGALVQAYEAVSAQLAAGEGDSDRLMAQLAQLSQRMESLRAWDLETQAKIILTQLGIQDFNAPVADLSGGYRKRIALATALLGQPEVLLMDEPTNHLDALSVEWLQSYLQRFPGALLLITHDRYFLDQVTNRILEVDRGDLYAYDGNYAYYLEQKALAEAAEQSTRQSHAGVLRRELEWLKRGPKARSTKQKARIQRIEQMQAKEFKQAHGKVAITTASRRIGKKGVRLEQVSKRFGDRVILDQFTFDLNPHDRIGIIGPNGVGKSTLLNLITGRTAPDQGQVEVGSTLHCGYFDQHSEELFKDPNQRVIDYLKEVGELVKTADGSVITASQMLERFLFTPNQQYAPLHKLSGGERRRLFLLRVLLEAPNVLILDEPTNDLDIQTLGVLEEYLEDFDGCVIVVSHDRYFLDRTVETILALEGGGQWQQYPGNYSVYLEFKRAAEAEAAAATSTENQPSSAIAAKPKHNTVKKLSYKEKRELTQLEQQIPDMEAEKHTLEHQLYNSPPTGFTELQTLSERLATLEQAIETATDRWMELAELEA
jgi:ATP-binding cassette subfamily F protein uup